MKTSTAPSRIKAIQFGEGTINMIRSDLAPLKVKFALVDGEASVCGYFERGNGWSGKTLAALEAFVSAVEEDAFGIIFDGVPTTENQQESSSDEPSQF